MTYDSSLAPIATAPVLAALGVEEIRISPERVEAFKKLYSKQYGKQIDENEAVEKARQLLRLMELIYVPMRRDELAIVEGRNNQLGIVRQLPPPQV